METKEEIRGRLLSQRLSLNSEEKSRFSLAIVERVLSSRLLEGVRTVGLYSPIKNEVETDRIFEGLGKGDIKRVYPKVGAAGIDFITVSRINELSAGAWGILEPTGRERVGIDEIDLILLPGIAFDERGYRIGFGKGFYDSALKEFGGLTIGLAYEFQVVRKLPENGGDVCCRCVMTEKREITSEGPRGGIL